MELTRTGVEYQIQQRQGGSPLIGGSHSFKFFMHDIGIDVPFCGVTERFW